MSSFLFGGRGGRVDLHVQNQSKASILADFFPLTFFSLFFLFFFFSSVLFLFWVPLLALITHKWIFSSLRTAFLSYTICIFQIAQNNFTEWIWGKNEVNFIMWMFVFILGNREEECHVPLNADAGYFFFSVSSMTL